MKLHGALDDYLVPPEKTLSLKKRPTHIDALYTSKAEYRKLLKDFRSELGSQQEKLYATRENSVLLILQGMDTSGKDGAIAHVFKGVNPQGCEVANFREPSEAELAHDFLWRAVLRLPPRGHIGIFNRSYYEDVLVPRVHPEILQKSGLPADCLPKDEKIWQWRFDAITSFERHLSRNGTKVLKCFLHLSKAEQSRRLSARLAKESHWWKLAGSDFKERELWDEYQAAYEAALPATSTDECPWYIIPADDKKNARLLLSKILLSTIDTLPLKVPKPASVDEKQIKEWRKSLEKA